MVRNIIIRVDNLVKMFCLNKWRNKNSFSVVPNDQPPFQCHDVAWLFSGMAAKCHKELDNLPRVSVQLNLKQYQVGVSYLVYLCRFTVRQYFVAISFLPSQIPVVVNSGIVKINRVDHTRGYCHVVTSSYDRVWRRQWPGWMIAFAAFTFFYSRRCGNFYSYNQQESHWITYGMLPHYINCQEHQQLQDKNHFVKGYGHSFGLKKTVTWLSFFTRLFYEPL